MLSFLAFLARSPHLLWRTCNILRKCSQSSWNVKKFLFEIGTNSKEARYWLKVFHAADKDAQRAFAVISIENSVFEEPYMLHGIGSAVAFLNQNDLKTVIIHGFDEQKHSLQRGKHTLFQQARQISDTLHEAGVRSQMFLNCSGILRGTLEKMTVDTSPLDWALSSNTVPILSSVAELEGNTITSMTPARAATLVSSYLQPTKLIHLNSLGGLRNRQGKVIGEVTIPMIDTASDYRLSPTSQGMVSLATKALSSLPLTSSVVITSAHSILKELFTHKGSGTILRHREPINVVHSVDDLDKKALIHLLERTFKRRVSISYFDDLREQLISAYITSSYSAIAIITKGPDSSCLIPYLDKFAVQIEHQGLGTGEVLWEEIRKDFSSLFWRSRPDNTINAWYFNQAEGSWASDSYTVFWYGISSPHLSHKVIEMANRISSTFNGPLLDQS